MRVDKVGVLSDEWSETETCRKCRCVYTYDRLDMVIKPNGRGKWSWWQAWVTCPECGYEAMVYPPKTAFRGLRQQLMDHNHEVHETTPLDTVLKNY
jgi:5-methylcytosine-specific restriction endonuclease McrA